MTGGTMVRVVLCALLLLASRVAAGRNDGAKSSEETQTDAALLFIANAYIPARTRINILGVPRVYTTQRYIRRQAPAAPAGSRQLLFCIHEIHESHFKRF